MAAAEIERPTLHVVPDVDESPMIDAESTAEETLTGRPVDLPEDVDGDSVAIYATVTGRDVTRQPILPAWARSRTDLAAAARWWAGTVAYRVAFHAWRSPVYGLRVIRWTPVGGGRLVGRTWQWMTDAESRPLRRSMVIAKDSDAYLRLVKQRDQTVRRRMVATAAGLAGLGGIGTASWVLLPWWAQAMLYGGLTLGLAQVGRPADKPLTSVAVSVTRYHRLTAERVREALCVLGITGMKDPKAITFPTEIHRDGPGQLARVNLPAGVEAVSVVEKRGKLSSALRLPIDQVWPIPGPDHAGQLDLWVGYQPASKMRPPKWGILADGARTSVFEPVAFGADQRQRPVSSPLFARNWLIGGMPGSGKSYAARALALVAALDSTVEFKIAEYKGTADFADFEPIASEYYCGVDDEAIAGGAGIIAWGLAEAERRGKRIKKFRAEGKAPEGKVTPELATAGVGLHPVVILIDEAHELFLADKDAAVGAERLIKRGRALGLIVILATQIPDKDSLPPNITRCVNMRWCLAVQDQVANDMILGTGSYKRGITGTSFRPEIDAGWGMVTGLKDPSAVRSFYPSEAEAKKILNRAVQLRGGRVQTSQEEQPRLDVLADVVRVWPTGRAGLQWQTLAEMLAETRPEAYGDLTAESVSSLVRGCGVPSEDVKADGRVLKGCKRLEIDAAVERRELTAR
ncbi:FtsK/SpoIIIE domain-containing protein [Streptosporangium sp. NPDC000563]|uniref:FtsK/SpoIIIE domain-containing protein n=1 Tax=Streptosporangium sp. NPDC000563 TaxID=3154366 RepID=UPI003333C027